MRMRQSLAQWEAAFHEEMVEDRERRQRLRQESATRARQRRAQKVVKHGTLRFVGLVAAIIATTVVVTIVMFESLALLMGA